MKLFWRGARERNQEVQERERTGCRKDRSRGARERDQGVQRREIRE